MKVRVHKAGDFLNPIIALAGDAQEIEHDLDASDTQPHRRSYVRAWFAYVEGTVYILKQTALSASLRSDNPARLSVAQFALLEEEAYDLNDKGQARSQPKYLRLAANLRFTARILHDLFGANLNLSVDAAPWADFLRAVEIRNRLTHPKDMEHFDVSDPELEMIRAVDSWFNDLVAEAARAISETIAAANRALDDTASGDN